MSLVTFTMRELMVYLAFGSLIFFFFQMITKRRSSKELPLPPGPYPWPIIGNLFQIKKNIPIRLAEMSQVYGPLISLRLGQRVMIVGSSPLAASEILKTHDHALSGRYVSPLLQGREPTIHNMNLAFSSKYDDGWRVIRNMYRSELFSRVALESRAYTRENKVMEMVKYLRSKEGEVIVIKDVFFITALNIISNITLSIDVVDYEGNGIGAGMMESLRRLIQVVSRPPLLDLYPQLAQWDVQGWYNQVMDIIVHELGVVWEDSIESKRNGSKSSSSLKDFTDILIEKGFTNQQINPLMQELFSAGTEATSLIIEWFMAELLKNQEVMQKAINEVMKQTHGNVVKDSDLGHLPFLEACFKETLRLHPPTPLLVARKALQTCEIMGFSIPKDSQILVSVWAINHDANIWDDPLSFKPERFVGSKLSYKGQDFEFLPFGSGRRMCPGESMVSKMALLIVASLILNFDWFLPNNMNPEKINMDDEVDITSHKKEPMLAIFKFRE